MPNKPNKEVERNKELAVDYSYWHDTWREQAKENRDYIFGKQWTSTEVDELNERGQAAVVINRVRPIIDQKMAIMAAKKPGVRVTGRDDSDVKKAKLWEDIISYIWDISNGDVIYTMSLFECLAYGNGYMYCYIDKYDDDGFGEVKVGYLNSLDVYPDPNAKDLLLRDADNILIVKYLSIDQAKNLYPDKESVIDNAEVEPRESITNELESSEAQIISGDINDPKTDTVKVIERYTKVRVPFYRVDIAGESLVLSEEEYRNIDKNIITEALDGEIDYVKIYKQRIKVVCSIGSELLYEYIMPLEEYPLVPLVNEYTGTPYSIGEPAFVKSSQDMINKLYSLMIAHTNTSTNTKLLLPEGAVDDIEEFKRDWSKPGFVGTWNDSVATRDPVIISPVPLPSALYQMASDFKYEMEYNSGVFALMQGSSQGAPDTFRGTLTIEEFGNRRIALKLRNIEKALSILFKNCIVLSQNHYRIEKVFRIVQPDGEQKQQSVNIPIVDEYSGEVIERFNDLSVGKYDIIVVAGSTLPSNRWALLQEYKDWYQAGVIDDIEVLKKTDIFDREGVMERKSALMQAMQQNEQLTKTVEEVNAQIKQMSEELLDKEKQLEMAKFTGKLDAELAKIRAEQKISKEKVKTSIEKAKMSIERDTRALSAGSQR